MSNASAPCPEDHPLMIAWNSHKQTDEYKNSKHWALAIQPMIQVGDPDADRKRYQLMPVDQREQHIEGSLWAVFCAGYNAAQAARTQRERKGERRVNFESYWSWRRNGTDRRKQDAATQAKDGISADVGEPNPQHAVAAPDAPTPETDAELLFCLRMMETLPMSDPRHRMTIKHAADRIESLSKDAGRYSWLRDRHNDGDDQWFVYGAHYFPDANGNQVANLDAAIDAALSERKGV